MPQSKDAFELATVVVSFVLLALSTRPIVTAADRVWTEEGLIYGLTSILGAPFGGNLDVPVLLVCGLLAGWLLLFCLDGTKRVQALFVLVGVGVPLGLFVDQTGRLAEAVVRTPWAAAVGLAAGLLSGAATSSRFYGVKRPPDLSPLEKLRWIQFPAAGGAFRYGMTAVAAVVVVDYATTAGGVLDRLLVTGAGVVLVGALSVFMRYDQRRTTVVVSPPDFAGEYKYQPYVVGGLYEAVELERHGYPIEGDGELVAARTPSRLADLQERFDSSVAFGFVSSMVRGLPVVPNDIADRLFLRTVIIESEGWTTDQIGAVARDPGSAVLPDAAAPVVSRARHHLRRFVPVAVRRALQGTHGSVLDRLESADTVLLVGPTPGSDAEAPDGADTLAALCERFGDRAGTDVVLATTEAAPVAESEGLAPDSKVFKRTVAVHRLGVDDATFGDIAVVPTDRFNGERAGGRPATGFDDLLDEVSG